MPIQDIISKEQLKKALPNLKDVDVWYDRMCDVLPKYGIDTKLRLAHFIAQTAHESGGYTVLKENLNYSADGLQKIFKKYFPDAATAEKYARKPEMIANRVYGGRLGNGPEASGDGFRYRGRGIVQLTGKENYAKLSASLNKGDELIKNPDLVAEPEYALHSACWYWKNRNINAAADRDDVEAVTKLINGGLIGIEDRKEKTKKLKEILSG